MRSARAQGALTNRRKGGGAMAVIYDTDDDGNMVVIFDSRWRCRVADYEDQALEKLEQREKKENEGG